MKYLFICFFLVHSAMSFSQNDIELVEERKDNKIELYAVNNTEEDIDLNLTIDVVGFEMSVASPVQKLLGSKAKELVATLTAAPGVACEYKTAASYKKVRKQSPNAVANTARTKTTSTQLNTTKINVFTQEGCGRCEYVINYLDKNNIPYVELNTTIHDPNQTLMFEKLQEAGFSGNSVQMPVVISNGKTSYSIKDLKAFVQNLK